MPADTKMVGKPNKQDAGMKPTPLLDKNIAQKYCINITSARETRHKHMKQRNDVKPVRTGSGSWALMTPVTRRFPLFRPLVA